MPQMVTAILTMPERKRCSLLPEIQPLSLLTLQASHCEIRLQRNFWSCPNRYYSVYTELIPYNFCFFTFLMRRKKVCEVKVKMKMNSEVKDPTLLRLSFKNSFRYKLSKGLVEFRGNQFNYFDLSFWTSNDLRSQKSRFLKAQNHQQYKSLRRLI